MKFKNANQRKAVMAKMNAYRCKINIPSVVKSKKKEKPIATCPQSNWGGIAIYDIDYDIDDKVKFRWEFGDKKERMRTAKIKSTKTGRHYFNSNGSRFYLDEFMKTDMR